MFGMGFALPLEARGIVASAPVNPTYAEVLRDTYGADVIWPLVDISSGTTIFEKVNSNRDGVLSGWDLQNIAGPVTGTLAPYSDGSIGDYGDIYTSNGLDGLDDIFNGQEFSFSCWVKMPAGAWVDGVQRRILTLSADGNNNIDIYKTNTATRIIFQYVAGGVGKNISYTTTATDWIYVGLSVSLAGDFAKAYANGAQVGVTQTGLGTWSGVLDSIRCLIGNKQVGQPSHLGHLGYFSLKTSGAVWTDADHLGIYNAAATAAPD